MAHTSEKRWAEVNSRVGNLALEMVNILNQAEEGFQQMQEAYNYAGGTATDLAYLLLKEIVDARPSPDNVPTTEEIAMVQDAIDAMTAMHQLWQAANNTAVTQADRMTDMRRMI